MGRHNGVPGSWPAVPVDLAKCSDGVAFAYFADPKTWDDAQASCVTTGGNLATFENLPQSKLLENVRQPNAGDCPHTWIGYRRGGDNLPFSWVDGSDSTYAKWANKNNQVGKLGKHCVGVRVGGDSTARSCKCNRRNLDRSAFLLGPT